MMGNWAWILGAGGLLAGFGLVILVLVRTNMLRRRAEAALGAAERELDAVRSSLEERVGELAAERTAALDRRRDQLEAAAHVAREAAAIRDIPLLLDTVVHLISDRMGFYHAGIFLLDEAPGYSGGARGSVKRYAVLRAASSEGGQRMLARGHRLEVGTTGIVGYAASSREPHIALDVGQDAVFFDNPDLPETRSEIALPLVVFGEVLGVLDVQSVERAAFGAEDVAALQTLADQVALAIENGRLLSEAEDRLREITVLAGERSAEGWRRLAAELAAKHAAKPTAERGVLKYTYDGVAVVPGGIESHSGEPVPGSRSVSDGSSTIEVLLHVEHEEVGRLRVALDGRPASAEEMELVGALAKRLSLALERARLFDEIQRRAANDRLVGEVTARVRETLDIRTVLETAANELYEQLGLEKVTIYLAGDDAAPGDDGAGTPGGRR